MQFLAAMVETGQKASALTKVFDPCPQLLKNVRFNADNDPMDSDEVKAAIAGAEVKLKANGRLLIRKSGTEPLVRVMAECEDEAVLQKAVNSVVAAVEKAVKKAV